MLCHRLERSTAPRTSPVSTTSCGLQSLAASALSCSRALLLPNSSAKRRHVPANEEPFQNRPDGQCTCLRVHCLAVLNLGITGRFINPIHGLSARRLDQRQQRLHCASHCNPASPPGTALQLAHLSGPLASTDPSVLVTSFEKQLARRACGLPDGIACRQ